MNQCESEMREFLLYHQNIKEKIDALTTSMYIYRERVTRMKLN